MTVTPSCHARIPKRWPVVLSALTLLSACVSTDAPAAAHRVADTALINGLWFDGQGFAPRTVYVSNGRFVDADWIDGARETVDLAGGHVVPPFCEGHNHNLGGGDEPEAWRDRYLKAGVFYVKILSNLPRQTDAVRPLFNRPDSVDVLFAGGGFTGPGGHPVSLRERLLDQGAYPGFTRETLADHAYFRIAGAEDVAPRFAAAQALNPDFIKIFLLRSDRYAELLNDPAMVGRRGMDPALAAQVVARAHAAGLKVSAHVETAADFRNAIAAGVDEIAHMPAYNSLAGLTAEEAALAAQRGVSVVTTLGFAATAVRDPAQLAAVKAVQSRNLRLLRDAGVKLIVGSDVYGDTSVGEAAYLRTLGVLSDAEVLTMWTRNCAEAATVGRRVGQMIDGYEASFLVLNGDPLTDWSATGRIQRRFKQGSWLPSI